MNLLDQVQEIERRLAAIGSPSDAQLAREILALTDVLKTLIHNTVQSQNQIVETISALAWRVSDLEKKKS